MTTTLQRVGNKARENPKERFTNLLSHIKVPLLKEAYLRLRKNAASGVDQVTWEEYGERLGERLLDLQDRVHRGSYHPQPVKRVHIPKGDGRTRPLGIPAVEDKIVQQAARMILEPIYEASFLGFSYGFRPGRSQHDALDALAIVITERKVGWVLDADIRSFFDTIDHGWMQKFLEHRIGDRRMVRLLMKWMRAGVIEEGEFRAVEEGTPQGGIISPLLANIYLHYVLDLWLQSWRKKHNQSEVYIVRYADDFVVATQYEKTARAIRAALANRLAKFGLELHPEKTRVLEFGRYARVNRERKGKKPETFTFLEFTHIAGVSLGEKFQLQRRTCRKKRRAKLVSLEEDIKKRRHEPIPDQHRWLKSVLLGHYRYYGVRTNYRAMAAFRNRVEFLWRYWLARRSQRALWSQERWNRHKRRYPLPAAKIYHPWPSQRFYSRHVSR